MPMQFELTDTFSGEANYSWVRRAHVNDDSPSNRQIVRKAKAWAGLTGRRCKVYAHGDDIEIRPHGLLWVLFANYAEPNSVQGECLDDAP